MTLSEQLRDLAARTLARTPAADAAALAAALDGVIASRVGEHALTEGDPIPAFALTDVAGMTVRSQALLDFGPLAIVFYRGGWCPFCNLELRAFRDMAPAIETVRATVIAISPELPDYMAATRDANALSFQLLHDTGNRVARDFGLVFELPEEVRDFYRRSGADLPVRHGDGRWELPVPATYVVDQGGRITLAYVNPDYRERLEPEEVLRELTRLRRQETGTA